MLYFYKIVNKKEKKANGVKERLTINDSSDNCVFKQE